jgi:hypothetical protein
MTPEWITWALQALIIFLVSVIWGKLHENGKQIVAVAKELGERIHGLELKLAESYVKKDAFEKLSDRLGNIETWRATTELLVKLLEKHLSTLNGPGK